MPTTTRNIQVTFTKNGPILTRDNIRVLESELADPTHSVSDMWIEENMTMVAIYLAVQYFPQEEIESQLRSNGLDWGRRAEHAYREEHQGKTIVFRDRS